MDFRITIDISECLEKSLQDLTSAIFSTRGFPTPEECRAKYFADVDPEAEYVRQENAENLAVETPKEPGAPVTQPEPEPAPTAPTAPQETVARGRIVENPAPEPVAVLPVAVEPAVAEPAEKPKKKKAPKKPVEAPETAPEPEAPVTQPEPEPAPTAPTAPQEAAKSDDDDPMCGMTVMDAMQAVMSEISEKGLEMADVNARVRARAAEAGIAYSSIICLIKAVGYKEARRVALGEK